MVIYMIKNTVNGKLYIGQTINTLKHRWRQHCSAKKDTHIRYAIEKYGKDNFTIEQIDSAETLEELNQKEEFWIKFYNATDREIGYNIKAGRGNHLIAEETKIKIGLANANKPPTSKCIEAARLAKKGKKLSKETCDKMSKSKMGHVVSEETRQKLREKRKSYVPTEETRRKMSEAKKGKKVQTDEKYKEMAEKRKGVKRPDSVIEMLKNRKLSKESLERGAAKRTGQKRTPEQRARMSANFKGGRTGQKNKPESILKMLETRRKNKEKK